MLLLHLSMQKYEQIYGGEILDKRKDCQTHIKFSQAVEQAGANCWPQKFAYSLYLYKGYVDM